LGGKDEGGGLEDVAAACDWGGYEKKTMIIFRGRDIE
jgi:hypothetical protein